MADIYQDGKIAYSKFLSSLFSSVSIFILSILCILNNLSLDLYSAFLLFKIVIPGGLSFWILGYIIGKKLDGLSGKIITRKLETEKQAYEIPSMFSSGGGEDTIMDMEEINGEKQ